MECFNDYIKNLNEEKKKGWNFEILISKEIDQNLILQNHDQKHLWEK